MRLVLKTIFLTVAAAAAVIGTVIGLCRMFDAAFGDGSPTPEKIAAFTQATGIRFPEGTSVLVDYYCPSFIGSGGSYMVKVRMPAPSLAPFLAQIGLQESDYHSNYLYPDPGLKDWDPPRGTAVVSFEGKTWNHFPVQALDIAYDVQDGNIRTVWIKAL